MELQRALLKACIEEKPNMDAIERLLRQGAKPLGRADGCGEYSGVVYSEILWHYLDRAVGDNEILKITELFIRYGMDVEQPEIPYDDIDVISPLWMLAFSYGECGVEMLEKLLDRGIGAASARECRRHMLELWCNRDSELRDAEGYKMFFEAVGKLLLIASYSRILEEDEELRQEIWYDKNDYDPIKFRQWRNYRYNAEPSSRGGKREDAYGCRVTVIEKESGRSVWTFVFGVPCESEKRVASLHESPPCL